VSLSKRRITRDLVLLCTEHDTCRRYALPVCLADPIVMGSQLFLFGRAICHSCQLPAQEEKQEDRKGTANRSAVCDVTWPLNPRRQNVSLVTSVRALKKYTGVEPFFRSCQLCSYSRVSQNFLEPESSLPS
jgi:hypothetical protein